MKHMKKVIFSLAVIGLVISFASQLSAQPLPGEQGNGSPTGGNPIAGMPIEGGGGILVAYGIAYAVSRYKIIAKKEE
jgi:hypothetical protein